MKLKLANKGLVLVAVPLCAQVLSLLLLSVLLFQLDQSAAKEARSRKLISDMSSLSKTCVDAGQRLCMYIFTRDDAYAMQLEESLRQGRASAGSLDYSWVKDNAEREDIQAYTDFVRQTLANMRKMLVAWHDHDQASPFYNPRFVREQIQEAVNKVPTLLTLVVKCESERSENYHLQMSHLKDLTFASLCGALGLAVVLSVAMATFFSRDITARLDRIVKDINRFADNRQLEPVIAGVDEIHFVHQTFHDLAASIRAAREKEQAIIDNTADVICALTADLKIAKISKSSLNMLGFVSEELVGKSILDYIFSRQGPVSVDAFAQLSASKNKTVVEDYQFLRPSGEKIWTRWTISWSSSQNMYYCVIHDVEKQKQLEQMKSQFIAMATHDIRAPISSTTAFLQLLLQGRLCGPVSDQAARLTNGVALGLERLLRLVEEILNIERLEEGTIELCHDKHYLSELTEETLSSLEGSIREKSIHVKIEDGTTESLICDGDRITQVIQNLLSNAIKFAPVGSVISISISDLGDLLEFRVTDQGPGIRHDKLLQVFDRFKQLDNQDRSSEKGFGLGLAICKAIVELHHGRIGVESQPGEGASFWMRLPKNGCALGAVTAQAGDHVKPRPENESVSSSGT